MNRAINGHFEFSERKGGKEGLGEVLAVCMKSTSSKPLLDLLLPHVP